MSDVIRGDSFDSIFNELLCSIMHNPDYICSPRNQLIKENLVSTIILSDPRSRIIENTARKANYGFAAGEFLWYWQGREDLKMMEYYNKRMKDFSNDGKTLNSAYGKRLMGKNIAHRITGQYSQWDICKKTLTSDHDSRRAVMLINDADDEYVAAIYGSKDVPCTLSLQFIIRDNKLNLHVLMRSNDIIWGLTNDLFSFTLLQECMLLDLKKEKGLENLELGSYYHTAGSMHLYERHFELAHEILNEYSPSFKFCKGMLPLDSLEQLQDLCIQEDLLRNKRIGKIDAEGRYSGGVKYLSELINGHREKRDAEGL